MEPPDPDTRTAYYSALPHLFDVHQSRAKPPTVCGVAGEQSQYVRKGLVARSYLRFEMRWEIVTPSRAFQEAKQDVGTWMN